MMTGEKTFEGKSRAQLMSAIATAKPEPLTKMQPDVPAALEHAVRTCLAKDPRDRWQTLRNLLSELEWVVRTGGESGLATVSAAPRKGTLLTRFQNTPELYRGRPQCSS